MTYISPKKLLLLFLAPLLVTGSVDAMLKVSKAVKPVATISPARPIFMSFVPRLKAVQENLGLSADALSTLVGNIFEILPSQSLSTQPIQSASGQIGGKGQSSLSPQAKKELTKLIKQGKITPLTQAEEPLENKPPKALAASGKKNLAWTSHSLLTSFSWLMTEQILTMLENSKLQPLFKSIALNPAGAPSTKPIQQISLADLVSAGEWKNVADMLNEITQKALLNVAPDILATSKETLAQIKDNNVTGKTLAELIELDNSQWNTLFKKLARQLHPDKGGDAEMMKQLNALNEVLKNPNTVESAKIELIAEANPNAADRLLKGELEANNPLRKAIEALLEKTSLQDVATAEEPLLITAPPATTAPVTTPPVTPPLGKTPPTGTDTETNKAKATSAIAKAARNYLARKAKKDALSKTPAIVNPPVNTKKKPIKENDAQEKPEVVEPVEIPAAPEKSGKRKKKAPDLSDLIRRAQAAIDEIDALLAE